MLSRRTFLAAMGAAASSTAITGDLLMFRALVLPAIALAVAAGQQQPKFTLKVHIGCGQLAGPSRQRQRRSAQAR